MLFDWDDKKAESNLAKHGVSFVEATTVFGDPLSETFDDPDHSFDERRYIIIGMSENNRLLLVAHSDDGVTIRKLARANQQDASESDMKKDLIEMEDDLRDEYDFSQLKNRVRGKYVERYQTGTNVVRLEPDVAEIFPDAQSVNEALRLLIKVAQTQVSQPRS